MIQMAARPLLSSALVTFTFCHGCQLGLVRMLEQSLGVMQMPLPGPQLLSWCTRAAEALRAGACAPQEKLLQ